jgi:Calcineurin-like phosphoesterase
MRPGRYFSFSVDFGPPLIQTCPKDDQFCFVGDLIARGLHSSRVVDLIIEQSWLCVMGNHEKMALENGIVQDYFGRDPAIVGSQVEPDRRTHSRDVSRY